MVRFLKGLVSVLLSIVMVLLCTGAVVGMLGLGVGLFHTAAHGTIGVWRYDLSFAGQEMILSQQLTSLTQLRTGDTVVVLDLAEESKTRAMLPVESVQSGSILVVNEQGISCAIPQSNLLGRVIWRAALPPVLEKLGGILPGGDHYLWYWLGGIWLVLCLALFFCCISLRRVMRRREIRKEMTRQHKMPESELDFSDLVMPEDPVELEEIPQEEEIPLLTIEDMYAATRQKRQELAEQSEEETE